MNLLHKKREISFSSINPHGPSSHICLLRRHVTFGGPPNIAICILFFFLWIFFAIQWLMDLVRLEVSIPTSPPSPFQDWYGICSCFLCLEQLRCAQTDCPSMKIKILCTLNWHRMKVLVQNRCWSLEFRTVYYVTRFELSHVSFVLFHC